MSLLSNSTPPSLLLPKTPQNTLHHTHNHLHCHSLSSFLHHSPRTFSFSGFSSSSSDNLRSRPISSVPDEWGEKSGPEPEIEPIRAATLDPTTREDEDEWGPGSSAGSQDGPPAVARVENLELKRALVDSVYGTNFGFRASSEIRAEISELVAKLEAMNPNPNPTEVPDFLDGNWFLAYTAYSELLPILAVGATPLAKVENITQAIDTGNQTVENSTTLSSPFATISFSASASFEVRSSSRIQVQFKEATFKPPEIKSSFDLPESVDVFGQKVNLSPIQQILNPVQEAAASISRTLYGLPPLKVPIPGERTSSWLLISYLDEDLRISRGDGGLFVLVREGSSLLEQWRP